MLRSVSGGMPPFPAESSLLDERQAAALLAISVRTLQTWRQRRSDALPFVKVGSLVRYRRSDLEILITAGLRRSTADPGPGEGTR